MEQFTQILEGSHFTTLDWCIVGAYLLVSVAIGLIANRYVANLTDYVVAGRGIRTALGIATLTGTELGLVTVMYNAQKGFTGGFAAFHIGVAAGRRSIFRRTHGIHHRPLAAPRGAHHSRVLRETLREKDPGPRGRILAFGGILNMGMFLKAGSMFIIGVTGLQSEAALLVVMVVLLGLVLFYTVLGGMVSVVPDGLHPVRRLVLRTSVRHGMGHLAHGMDPDLRHRSRTHGRGRIQPLPCGKQLWCRVRRLDAVRCRRGRGAPYGPHP